MKAFFILFLFFAANVQAQTTTTSDYEKAKSAFESSQLDDAYIHLKNSLNTDNTHLPSKILMGKILAISFFYDDAIVEFEEAIAAGADRNLVIEYYANSMLVQGQFDDITLLSERGLTRKNKAFLKTVQAKSYNALGDSDQAAALFKEAIFLDNANPNILVSYSRFLAQYEKLDEAMSFVVEALSIEPENTEALRTKANIHKYKGELESYYSTLERALELDSEQPLALRDLISAYVSKSEYLKAKTLLEKVLSAAPNDPMAKFLFSWVSTNLGEFDVANSTLEELVNYLSLIDDDAMQNAETLIYISGLANYAVGNVEAASTELNKYLSKRPNDLNASILLSEIYVQEGNFTGAVRLMDRFKDLALEDISFGDKLCTLYIQANANHTCNWLVLQMSKRFGSDPNFLALKAKSLASRGKPEEALLELSKIQVETESTILDRALLSIEANQLELANEQIVKLLELQKDNNDYKNLLASVYIKKGSINEAEALLNNILDTNEGHFSARFNMASVKFKQSKYKEALDITSTLLSERNSQSTVMLLQAKALKRLGNNEEALVVLSDILRIDSDYMEAKLELSDLYLILGELDNALNILNQILKDNFLDPIYLSKRAVIHTAKRDYTSAQKDLGLLYNIWSKEPSSLLQLANLQRDAQDLDGALKSVDTAIELSPKEYNYQRERARLLLQTFNIAEAKKQIMALEKSFEMTADTHLLMGDLALIEEDKKSATKHYHNAVIAQNNFLQALVKRYKMAQLGFEEAEFTALFESILEDNSSTDFARNLLADYYSKNKINDKAKLHYLVIMKNDSYLYLPVIMNNLANIYLVEGNVNTAYELAQKANNQQPNNQAIIDTLGWSLAKLNRYDEALNYLRLSYSMNTADPAVRYHLGYVLDKLGRTEDARKELQNLLEQFVDFDDKEEAQKLLEKL